LQRGIPKGLNRAVNITGREAVSSASTHDHGNDQRNQSTFDEVVTQYSCVDLRQQCLGWPVVGIDLVEHHPD
jgi:hypothetical protein